MQRAILLIGALREETGDNARIVVVVGRRLRGRLVKERKRGRMSSSQMYCADVSLVSREGAGQRGYVGAEQYWQLRIGVAGCQWKEGE